MIDDILIFDNVVSSVYQNFIQERIMDDRNFPWYYTPNITKRTSGENTLDLDNAGFGHTFYNKNGVQSKIYEFLLPLMYESCSKINFTPTKLHFGRIFMTLTSNNTKHNLFHVDLVIPHLVVLYYINDSTGPTIITNNTILDVDQDTINNLEHIEVIKTIEPKKGRAVVFDGKYYHASTHPRAGRRCVINFDIG